MTPHADPLHRGQVLGHAWLGAVWSNWVQWLVMLLMLVGAYAEVTGIRVSGLSRGAGTSRHLQRCRTSSSGSVFDIESGRHVPECRNLGLSAVDKKQETRSNKGRLCQSFTRGAHKKSDVAPRMRRHSPDGPLSVYWMRIRLVAKTKTYQDLPRPTTRTTKRVDASPVGLHHLGRSWLRGRLRTRMSLWSCCLPVARHVLSAVQVIRWSDLLCFSERCHQPNGTWLFAEKERIQEIGFCQKVSGAKL